MSKNKVATGYAKTDVRYWQKVIFQPTYTHDGVRHRVPHWSVKIQHGGRRETFALDTPNKAAAAATAREIFLALKAEGWDAVVARFKPSTQASNSPVTTVGNFLEAVKAIWSGHPKTLADYARAFRKIVADIFDIDGDRTKYDHRTGGREAWIARVHQVRLSELTPDKIQRWKVKFLKRSDPAKQRSASISVNSLMRQAKSLFAPDIVKFIPNLPPSPFEGVPFEPRRSTRYQSAFDLKSIIRAAQDELPPEQFKIFLLALMAGLRRNEIDKLEWGAFDWDRNQISIQTTQYFHPKSEDSTGDVEVDPEVMELFRGFKARSTGNFVVESPIAPRPEASYSHYRCQKLFKSIANWLRDHGLTGGRPLHTLRKEYGSQICAKHGIYAASRALRHSDIAITSQHYLDRRVPARAGLGVFLSPPPNVVPIASPKSKAIGERRRAI
ncbi:MAG: tyrosine-type recombinase/integrase [Chthoniobacterales bacterium]|nr:tyrosine-type recombinase/integrase [Chthoniobacterales bacterium]